MRGGTCVRFFWMICDTTADGNFFFPFTRHPGAIIRYGMSGVGEEVTKLTVKPAAPGPVVRNATKNGPPDFLLLDVGTIRSEKTKEKLMNTTLSYSFKVRN